MKVKKKYNYTDGNQVWRIMLTETDQLFIETRDTDKKEAFFHCLQLDNGKPIFTKLQMIEKYWLGVESIYKNLVLFHRFSKPDMPGHKGIFAFDINSQNILWENEEYTFLFILDNKIFAYQEKFDGKKVVTISVENGKVTEDLGDNPANISELKDLADNTIDYSDYKFPEFFYETSHNPTYDELIKNEIKNLSIIGNIEFIHFANFLIFNYHSQRKNKGVTNKIIVCDIQRKKQIFTELLNTNLNAYAPDSFIVYKNLLILIKEKNQVIIYDLLE